MDSLSLDVPEKCGVMLLSGTPLFPHSSMDLHIFEPRYRQMLSETLQDTWMFAIANLVAPEELPYEDCVAPIGTIVLINSSRTLPDGRSALVVTGIYPVKFDSWIDDAPYPTAKISILEREEIGNTQESSIKSLILDYTEDQLANVPPDVKDSVMNSLREMSTMTALIDNVSHNFVGDSDLRNELMIEMRDEVRASKLIKAISN